MFDYPIAFSDHSPGADMDIAAIALGANLVEKTITMDRTTRSVEHIMSLEPPEMAAFVKLMRELPVALGHKRRLMGEEERKKTMSMRRSIFAKSDIAVGDVVNEDALDYRRPGFGIAPSELDKVLGKTCVKSVAAGEMIAWADLD